MKLKKSDIEPFGERMLLTEPKPAFSEDRVKRYELAKERYRAYYSALELILEPRILALVNKTLEASREVDTCMLEYCSGRKREEPPHPETTSGAEAENKV